jgi:hypothetical protein
MVLLGSASEPANVLSEIASDRQNVNEGVDFL